MSPNRAPGGLAGEGVEELVAGHPTRQPEPPAPEQAGVELGGAEGGQALHAAPGVVEKLAGELEAEPGQRPAETGQHLRLPALDVDLDQVGRPVLGDQPVEGDHRHRDPVLPGEAGEAAGAPLVDPEGGDLRVAAADVEGRLAGLGADPGGHHTDPGVAREAPLQDAEAVGLGLEADHPGPEARQHRGVVALGGADVEDQVAGADDAGVEGAHPRPLDGVRQGGQQRPQPPLDGGRQQAGQRGTVHLGRATSAPMVAQVGRRRTPRRYNGTPPPGGNHAR